MAINEIYVTGRKHRRLIDKAAKLWQTISFWTKASDVEFNDGQNAESKLGSIKGITDSTSISELGYAADASVVSKIKSNLNVKVDRYDSSTKTLYLVSVK